MQAQYDTLQFPYNQLAFLPHAVVDEKEADNTDTAFLDTGLKKIPVNIQVDATADRGYLITLMTRILKCLSMEKVLSTKR